MPSFRVKIDDWAVCYKQTTNSFHILHNNEEKKVVKSKKFGERGMLTFPAPLLKLVRSELRHANTYDRLLDKYFEHVEEKSWNEHV